MSKSNQKKSKIWIHFSPINEDKKVNCLYCNQKLSVANKSTCALIRHISKKHPTQNLLKQAHTQSNRHIQSTSTAVTVTSSIRTIKKKGKIKDNLICTNTIDMKKQEEIDRQLVKLIAKEYHPLSVVEDKEFVKFINLLNPTYQLPTKKTMSKTLTTIYDETVEKVKKRLARASAVCLTADGWTSKTEEYFYAFTAHYIVDNNYGIVLDSDLLGCVSFTQQQSAVSIANKIKDLTVEWEIVDKVTVIVSDGIPNIKAAVTLGEWRHWNCFAHSLNLIAKAGIKEIEAVVDKIKVIVSLFKGNYHATDQLNATQEIMNLPICLKLKTDVPTRWNSTYDMMKRILSVQSAIESTIAVLKSSPEYPDFEEVDELTHHEWLIIKQAVQVLEVFDTLTTVISSQNEVTMSSIIIFIKQLKIHLHKFENDQLNLMPAINKMVARLIIEINISFFSKLNHIEENDLVGMNTILDPRYKKFGFIDETKYKRMLEELYNQVTQMRLIETSEYQQNNDKGFDENMGSSISKVNKLEDMLFNNFDNEVQKYIRPANALASAVKEVDKYLQEPLLPRKDENGVNTDPLLWWFQRKHIYPRLYQLVKTRFSMIATSVPCERIFSHSGQIICEKRANLKSNEITNVVFLNYNFSIP